MLRSRETLSRTGNGRAASFSRITQTPPVVTKALLLPGNHRSTNLSCWSSR